MEALATRRVETRDTTMRILHTSDWHLGRTLHKAPLVQAQEAAMRQIADIAADQRVDLVVVSGDVFDHAVPSAQALELLEETLYSLLRICPVVVTAGNHDSLRRLGYGARLMSHSLVLQTTVEAVGTGVSFQDEHGTVRVYPIPYLHPDTARYPLAVDPEHPLKPTHHAVLDEAMARVRADLARHEGARSVVLAHAWVTGCTGSDSERDVSVGGLGTVSSAVFTGVDYVALGHLHGPQDVAGAGPTRLRYCGSPLRYSFSEADQVKSVTIVDLGAHGVESVQDVPISQPRPMANLRGLMDELLDPELFLDVAGAWVSIVVTDDRRPGHMWQRLQERFPHALQIRHEPQSQTAQTIAGPTREQKPLEVASDFVQYVTNGPITADETAAFDAAVQAVREAVRA